MTKDFDPSKNQSEDDFMQIADATLEKQGDTYTTPEKPEDNTPVAEVISLPFGHEHVQPIPVKEVHEMLAKDEEAANNERSPFFTKKRIISALAVVGLASGILTASNALKQKPVSGETIAYVEPGKGAIDAVCPAAQALVDKEHPGGKAIECVKPAIDAQKQLPTVRPGQGFRVTLSQNEFDKFSKHYPVNVEPVK